MVVTRTRPTYHLGQYLNSDNAVLRLFSRWNGLIVPTHEVKIELFLLEFNGRESTHVNYGRFLRFFNEWFQTQDFILSELSPARWEAFLATRNWGGGTPYNCWQAIKAYLKWEFGRDYPCKRMHVYRPDPGPQRTLDTSEVKQLIAAIDTTSQAGKRNLPLVLLMLDTGLRAQEVSGLLLKHLEIPKRRLWVEGKGGKWREAVYSERTAVYLEDWLAIRAQITLPDNTTVFCGMGGLKPGSALTKDGLRSVFRAMGKRAGIAGLSPHVMRRTFATLAIRQGASTRLVQVAGGWANIEMVQRYTQDIRPADFDGFFATNLIGGFDDE